MQVRHSPVGIRPLGRILNFWAYVDIFELVYDLALRVVDELHFGPREILAISSACRRQRSVGALSEENQRSGFVASQGRGRDAEEAELGRENRLPFELDVAFCLRGLERALSRFRAFIWERPTVCDCESPSA